MKRGELMDNEETSSIFETEENRPTVKEIEICDVHTFLHELNNIGSLQKSNINLFSQKHIFRGHLDSNWELIPKLGRKPSTILSKLEELKFDSEIEIRDLALDILESVEIMLLNELRIRLPYHGVKLDESEVLDEENGEIE